MSARMMISTEEYSLSSLITDVIGAIAVRAFFARIRFAVNLDSNLPDSLIGDEARLRQVLIDVLGYAIKHTEKGYVFLKVAGELISDSAAKLKIEVEYSGGGMDPVGVAALFDKSCQNETVPGDYAHSEECLPVTIDTINSIGGDITAESESGKGSIFTVTLPQGTVGFKKLATVGSSAKISALVCEQRRVYAASLVYAIRNLGAKCELARDCDDLICKLGSGSYSCVFLPGSIYGANKDKLLKYNDKTNFILLAESGQAIPDEHLSVLHMPVHALSVASHLNGLTDSGGAEIAVAGLNTVNGILMSGGDVNLYCETLAIYCEDALFRIDKLRECLENHDIELYTTYVHALKSACANVGAEKLSAAAYELEMAGQRGDMHYVMSNNEEFITELIAMISKISSVLSERAGSGADGGDSGAGADGVHSGAPLDSAQFVAELKNLKNALDDMSAGAIDRAVANLSDLARTDEEKAIAKNISRRILMGEYDEVIALIDIAGGQVLCFVD